MNINYKIKNFRTFDENGAEIDIAPITILTGCNSSGKSSITKSLLLLGDYCEELHASKIKNPFLRIDFQHAKMDFQKNNNLSLGAFNKVINNGNADGIIYFEYRMHSHFISDDIVVKIKFSADKSENSNNGYLIGYIISDKDGHVLFSSEEHGLHYDNLNLLLYSFHDFYRYYLLTKQLSDLKEHAKKNESFQKKVVEKNIEIEEFLKNKSKTLSLDLTFCQRYANLKKIFNDNALVPLQKLEDEGTLFYLNNWSWFKSLNPKNIVKEINVKLKYIQQDSKFKELTDLVINDFIKSGESNFIDYYLHKSCSFLEENYTSDSEDFFVRSYNSIYLDQDFCDEKEDDDIIYLHDGTKISMSSETEMYEQEKNHRRVNIDFDMVYQVAVTIDYCIDNNDEYYNPIHGKRLKFEHRLFSPFNAFAKWVSDEALSPFFLRKLRYVSTSRVTVQRIYTYQGNEFSKLIEEYTENKRNRNSFLSFLYNYDSFINKWIKAFGIGDSIILENDEEGIGTKIKLKRGECIRLLADEGYGITQLVSILLQIEVAIQNSNKTRQSIGRKFDEENRGTFCEDTLIIEEPEIHLHPKYQSLLADMLTDAYLNYNIHFIVETHSEYLIRRLQNIIGDTQSGLKPKNVSINYVYSKDNPDYNLSNPIKRIDIKSDGRLEDSFGKGFFDEADRQVEELVNRKVERHGRFSKKK